MACALCDYSDFRFVVERKHFRIDMCQSCELVQVTNVPGEEKLYQIYDTAWFEYYYAGLEKSVRQQRYVYLNFKNKLEQIERRIGGQGKILVVGCSFGFFLDSARQRGWFVEGLDVSAHIVEYARSKLNLSVQCVPITEANYPEKSFDVITMWYVMEHLPNPKASLRYLSHLLKDNGILVIGTPNVDSNIARLQGKRWRMWLPPEHLLYFSPRTMGELLRRCNLEIIHHEAALPYEGYLRRMKLYELVNKMNLSDNVIYYAKKRSRCLDVGSVFFKSEETSILESKARGTSRLMNA